MENPRSLRVTTLETMQFCQISFTFYNFETTFRLHETLGTYIYRVIPVCPEISYQSRDFRYVRIDLAFHCDTHSRLMSMRMFMQIRLFKDQSARKTESDRSSLTRRVFSLCRRERCASALKCSILFENPCFDRTLSRSTCHQTVKAPTHRLFITMNACNICAGVSRRKSFFPVPFLSLLYLVL